MKTSKNGKTHNPYPIFTKLLRKTIDLNQNFKTLNIIKSATATLNTKLPKLPAVSKINYIRRVRNSIKVKKETKA